MAHMFLHVGKRKLAARKAMEPRCEKVKLAQAPHNTYTPKCIVL